jgi:hypothetical protein
MSVDTVHERSVERSALLESVGRACGELRLAVAFTVGLAGDDAKTAKDWKKSRPLGTGDQGAAIVVNRCRQRNPVVVLGASGLVGIDIDGEAGRELVRSLELELPRTVSVVSGRVDGGAHLWYRPPAGAPAHVVKVQLAERVTVSGDGYLVLPGAVHGETGRLYRFAEGLAPWEVEIAELPLATAERLEAEHRKGEAAAVISIGPVGPGDRHAHLRRLAYVMRRYAGASLPALEAALVAENRARCAPPKSEQHVRELARDTDARIVAKGSE